MVRQSAPSSSAMICGSSVVTPCPISHCGTIVLTWPSSPILRKALKICSSRGAYQGRGGAHERARHGAALARQRVVEGKSVSVRVGLGGRRIIKQKHTLREGDQLTTN